MNQRGKEIHLARLKDPDCKRCSLYRSTKHVCILGKGNVMSSIVLVGEAPGAAEEKTGKPFMGRAGKLLDRLLTSLNLQDKVYITNPVHCRPPDNRKPTKKEIEACRIYFDGELNIVKPKVIILMGRTAIEAYGFGSEVNAGTKPFLFDDTWYIISTWHPSYCLRRGKAATHDLLKALRCAKEQLKYDNKTMFTLH